MKTLPLMASIPLLTLATLLLTARPATAAERTVLSLKFERRAYPFEPAGNDAPPTVSQDETGAQCKLVSNLPDDDSETLPVWEVTNPPLARGPFSIVGTVAYRNVRTQARVEMDVEYPDGTHDHVGENPARSVELRGTSAGRPFRLDYPGQPDAVPRVLTLCVMIQGKGVVTISDAKLVVPIPSISAPATRPGSAVGPTRMTNVAVPPTREIVIGNGLSAGGPADPAARAWMEQLQKDRRDMPNAGLKYMDQTDATPGTISGLKLTARNDSQHDGQSPPAPLDPQATLAASLDESLAGFGPAQLADAREKAAARLQELRDSPRAKTGDSLQSIQVGEAIVAAFDRRIAALAAPRTDGPTTNPNPVPGGVPLRDLPPAVALKLRQSMEDTLVRALSIRDTEANDLKAKEQLLGVGHPEVRIARMHVKNLDQQITDLRRALAEPMPAVPTTQTVTVPPTPADGWRNMSFSDRAYWSFSQFLMIHVGVVFGGVLMWTFVRQGHFRRLATVYFAIVIVYGLAEIFVAGFAVGKDAPPEVAVVFLCGALVMIGVPVLLLPHLNRVHADIELRKLRAMDVA